MTNLNIKSKFQTYLQKYTGTIRMASDAIGVQPTQLTKYKRQLEAKKLLIEVGKYPCRITGRSAWYLSCKKSIIKQHLKSNSYGKKS